MNTVILMGRLTKDPEVRYGGANNTAVARYTVAVDRKFKQDGQPSADFFNIVSFGKQGEFASQYLKKGTKVVIQGELRTNNYTNKDGQKVYTTDIVTNSVEFAESKKTETQSQPQPTPQGETDWMAVDALGDEELPFK